MARALSGVVEPTLYWLDNIGNILSLTARTVLWLFKRPFRVSQMMAAMEFIGVQSIFIVGLTGTFSGMVLALQTTYALRAFSAEGRVGGIVAVSLSREVAPVFSGIMVTARAGSAMAAELGNMRVTEQIDAIATMGVSPIQYLLSPRLLGAVLMVPLLCILYTSVGMCGAYLVAVQWMGVDPGLFVSNIEKNMVPHDFYMGLIKSAVFGFLISAISCTRGFYASGGARGVGQATTEAVVHSAVTLLIMNYLLTSWLMGNPT